jgi:hypothetical protein
MMAKDIFDEEKTVDLSEMKLFGARADVVPSFLTMPCAVGEFSFRCRLDRVSAYWGSKTEPCLLFIQVDTLTHKSRFQSQVDRDQALNKLDKIMDRSVIDY